MTQHRYDDPRLTVRADDTYRSYADRVAALGSHGEPDIHPGNPQARGVEIDRRARELLKTAGIERPDFREYRDAVCLAAAQLADAGLRVMTR